MPTTTLTLETVEDTVAGIRQRFSSCASCCEPEKEAHRLSLYRHVLKAIAEDTRPGVHVHLAQAALKAEEV